jgi:hypothetical protein
VLLKRIRGFNGFHQFLLPKSISELWPAIKKGPVVFLNVSLDSCDALVLCLGNGVIHVPLPAFTPDHVKMLTQSLQHLMPYMGRGDMERLYGCREGGSTSLEEDFAYILSELWIRVVKPVLDALGITVSFLTQTT